MKKILFIEDDSVLRENTAELLELADYEVVTAPNGKIGVALAKKELPDIVVCDIMMPEMDGYGVLEALGEHGSTQYIPFIFLSAKTEHKDVRKGMNLGADDYLTKPFEEEELIGAIESRLAKIALLKNIARGNTERAGVTSRDHIDSLNALRDYMRDFDERIYEDGDVIYEEGKQNNQFFMVERGIVKGHRMDEYGKELITSIYKEGDFFGNTSLNKNSNYEEYATAMEKSTIYSISKEALKDILVNNHDVTLDLIDIMGGHIEGAKEQLLEMAYGTVRRKTAATILMFSQKIRKFPTHSIRISRSDLASVAGMAPESLIRTLSDFKKEGMIEIHGRNIELLDVEGLKNIG